ncbi:MAG: hypothetical protein COX07_06060 [Bacteroidetes bacterium CG23_combo_of_CG06-09_8_20_14_all_32_9]|nr:MAG: hypothetical protein COX07_06060 [Bacteroidetes bacterium CG23_combo_of_CG06-09_8_20_14_all_32_9]
MASCNDLSSPYPAGKLCRSYCDDSLAGYWEFIGTDDFSKNGLSIDSHLLVIVPFNKKEYLIQNLEFNDSEKVSFKDLGIFKGFISTIGKQRIANIQMLVPGEENKNEYLIYPFNLIGDTLSFYGFSSELIKQEFHSTCELRKFLKKNIENKSLFSAIRRYKKKYNK